LTKGFKMASISAISSSRMSARRVGQCCSQICPRVLDLVLLTQRQERVLCHVLGDPATSGEEPSKPYGASPLLPVDVLDPDTTS
jgi:hypothetical protein